MTKNQEWSKLIELAIGRVLNSIQEPFDRVEVELSDSEAHWSIYHETYNQISGSISLEAGADLDRIAKAVVRHVAMIMTITAHPAGEAMLDALDAHRLFPDKYPVQAFFLYDLSRTVRSIVPGVEDPILIPPTDLLLESFMENIRSEARSIVANNINAEIRRRGHLCPVCSKTMIRDEFNELSCPDVNNHDI